MIQKTYLGAKKCDAIDKLVVATDSEEIAALVREVGGDVIMTPEDLQTGSDRTAYVAKEFSDFDVIINLQGDEPFIRPEMLAELISPFHLPMQPDMATVAYSLLPGEYNDPNIVKVILDQHNNAIYFSRSGIPFFRNEILDAPVLHHMGLYAYKREFLLHYTTLPQTPLEKAEALEQLRALEHGYKIRVTKSHHRTFEINTKEELALAQSF